MNPLIDIVETIAGILAALPVHPLIRKPLLQPLQGILVHPTADILY